MKTSRIFIIALLLCVCSFAQAQTNKEIQASAKAKTEKLVIALDLTENQEMMIYRQVYTLENQTVRYNAVEDKTEKIENSYNSQVAEIESNVIKQLTDDQRAIFDEAWKSSMK